MSSATSLQPGAPPRRKVTIPSLNKKMKEGEAIVQMAVYDYRSAVVADRLGIDILCVSDTGGMVLFGHRSTVSVSFEEVMFMAQAVENAGRFVAQANAEVMKCEGNRHHVRNIEAIIKAGIPVQGHIGITPMRMPQLGGFVAQGKNAARALELVDDARQMVDAGCFSIMCEVTTEEVCQFLTETLPVPVISLGAGNKAHGVHIISSDLFHLYEEHTPRHSKIYTDLIPIIEDVYTRYMTEVRARTYPGPEHTVYMAPKELEQFATKVGWTNPPIEAAEQREKGKRKPAQSAA